MLCAIRTQTNIILLLYTLSFSSTTLASVFNEVPKSNPLNIDWYPAPSPEEGPPLSAGALRDKSLLPAEIGGILGAYVFVVIIVGIGLVRLGRKRRIFAQTATKILDIEMVEPRNLRNIDTSLHSPGANPSSPRNFSWPSPENDAKNPYVFPSNGLSPTTPVGTDPYVDARVVEADQEMMQRDLEDLYAHVMEQEDAKRNGANIKEMAPPPILQRAMASVPAAAPQRQSSPKKIEKSRPSNLNLEEPKQKSHSRTSSIISALKSPLRKNAKDMRISAPILSPKATTFCGNASDEEPLTPKYYKPPPPIPTDQVPLSHIRQSSNGNSPTRSIASQLSPYGESSRHRPNLSQTSMASSHRGDPISATSATSQTPLFSGPALSLQAPPLKFASQNPYAQQQTPTQSTRALPFRSFEPALTSPSFKPQITKTTVLERTVQGNGPNTSGLKTPWSAGAVPYSPYQPFTPMMPVTPRLVTKEERKAKKKMEGRTPVLEMIKAEDDIWDTAY